jgi:hypothetical protein
MAKWADAMAAMGASLLLVGCGAGDSGACIKEVSIGASYTYCSDDWEQAECEERKGPDAPGGTFHQGDTCEDLGYDYYCASTYTYHMSSANCD